ncbi:hypothetical protein [Ktedonospora formicarum]|uniref:Uncharacterized protein n=1 Tax=Ktedonospora formicarum TaxID=2778364 RepID=A0A8J3MTN3_9CHLR|nr:hypothetical protein [Ktedonospora formicarum]GHO45778.1 hypothetical protein KSX_39410 [Ktedonospora formicarum]
MSELSWLASLLKSRNTIDSKIATLIGGPAQVGNVAEYIAVTIFRIQPDKDGKRRGYDGRFTYGSLAGQTVDVQWRPRRDGQLNVKIDAVPDYYLVFTGPELLPTVGNPWLIDAVYLFHAHQLLNALRERGVHISSGTSVTGPLWERAEIYPVAKNLQLLLSEEERQLLALFK